MLGERNCPACASRVTAIIQPIYLQRQKKSTDQFYCLECSTFFHISGYRESDDQLKADVRWLEDHPGDYRRLLKKTLTLALRSRSALEIGCGTGELLRQLTTFGVTAEGVDVNPHAVVVARDRNLNASAESFCPNGKIYDLLFIVDVLEHLSEPRLMIKGAAGLVADNGAFIIRVPLVDRAEWKFLFGASAQSDHFDIDNPFRDNSVHITHFSTDGMKRMLKDFGFHWSEFFEGFFIFKRRPPEALRRPFWKLF